MTNVLMGEIERIWHFIEALNHIYLIYSKTSKKRILLLVYID